MSDARHDLGTGFAPATVTIGTVTVTWAEAEQAVASANYVPSQQPVTVPSQAPVATPDVLDDAQTPTPVQQPQPVTTGAPVQQPTPVVTGTPVQQPTPVKNTATPTPQPQRPSSSAKA